MLYLPKSMGHATLKNQTSGTSGNVEPIPVMVLGRLAIDTSMQGQRLGSALLKGALLRTLSASKNVGIRAILVHAISEGARRFYLGYGFRLLTL